MKHLSLSSKIYLANTDLVVVRPLLNPHISGLLTNTGMPLDTDPSSQMPGGHLFHTLHKKQQLAPRLGTETPGMGPRAREWVRKKKKGTRKV